MDATQNFYKINQVAAFFGINASALRYYERYGVLTPAFIDAKNGYRYYSLDNVNTIFYILELRNSEMDMAQIKLFLNEEFSRREYIAELEKKKDILEKTIKLNKLFIAEKNAYDVEVIRVPDRHLYVKKYDAANVAEIENSFFEFMGDAVKNVAVADSLTVAFIKYDTLIPEFENLHFEVGIEAVCKMKNTVLEPSHTAIRTFHKGSYESVGEAYEVLLSYAAENKIELKGCALEYYHESHNLHKNPDDNLTEIVFPVK